MKSRDEIIRLLKSEKSFLHDKYSISEIALFGSYCRDEQKSRSDVDLMVTFEEYPDLFAYVEIIDYLKSKLRNKVDLITKSAVRNEILPFILSEAVYI